MKVSLRMPTVSEDLPFVDSVGSAVRHSQRAKNCLLTNSAVIIGLYAPNINHTACLTCEQELEALFAWTNKKDDSRG